MNNRNLPMLSEAQLGYIRRMSDPQPFVIDDSGCGDFRPSISMEFEALRRAFNTATIEAKITTQQAGTIVCVLHQQGFKIVSVAE